MTGDRSISSAEFVAMVGGSVDDMTDDEVKFLGEGGLTYRHLTSEEQSSTLAGIVHELDVGEMPVSGPGMRSLWEKNWAAQLQDVIGSGSDGTVNRTVVPDFIQDRDVVRLNGEYVTTRSAEFELNLANLFRKWLFRRYFPDVNWIGDFGAGSGLNLGFLADLYPDVQLRGFDWSESAVAIIDHIGEVKNADLKGQLFDFVAPDPAIVFPPGAGVLTWGALEQIGDQFQPFLDWVRVRDPRIVVHVEPIVDWYNENSAIDDVAIRYHEMRGYLKELWPALQSLESTGDIEILKNKRLGFGSLYHEVYSFIVWRPLPSGDAQRD